MSHTFPRETEIEAVITDDDYDEDRRITHLTVKRGGEPLFTVQITPEDAVVFVEAEDRDWGVFSVDRR
jgi:hypothetical protein